MTIVLYEAKESGDLKLVAASEQANVGLAVDEFIDENPRNKLRSFVYLDTDDMESGTFGSVEVEDDAPVQPRRKMKISGNGSTAGLLESTEPAEAPAPRQRRTARRQSAPKATPKPAAKKTAAKKPASKPAAKKPASKPKVAPKAAAGKPRGKSPFTRNPASDE